MLLSWGEKAVIKSVSQKLSCKLKTPKAGGVALKVTSKDEIIIINDV